MPALRSSAASASSWMLAALAGCICTPTVHAQEFLIRGLPEPVSDVLHLPDEEPSSFDRELEISACPGEFEPASFLVSSLSEPLERVRIVSTDLVSQEGRVLEKSNVSVKYVLTWYQAENAWSHIQRRSPNAARLVPELLVNDPQIVRVDHQLKKNFLKVRRGEGRYGYIDISGAGDVRPPSVIPIPNLDVRDSDALLPQNLPAHTTRQIWITFAVPEDAQPGVYSGAIEVSAGERNTRRVLLNLTVLPFVLPPPPIEYSIYYRGVLSTDGSISSEAKSERQMMAELLDMRAHGIGNPTVYQDFDDRKALRAVLDLRAAAGIQADRLYYLGLRTEDVGPNAAQGYGRRVRELRKLVQPYGVRDLYIYGIDEAADELLQKQRAAWRSVHEAGGKVFAAGWRGGHFAAVGDALDLFISGEHPDKNEIGRFHAAGKRVFLYNRPQSGVENPQVYREAYGLALWRAGYDGAMIYAYQHGFGSIWNDFDNAKFRDHNFTYPAADGVISTLAWEGLREGVDDVRYVAALQRELQAAATDDRRGGQTYTQAVRFIEELRRPGRASLSNQRGQIVAQIMQLRGERP